MRDSAPAGQVIIRVKDNGIGIDSAVQPHVFELFAQSARGHTRAEGGLGIGLAVAKRMVELHEGNISLQSEGAGTGTVVTLRLPILRNTSAPALPEQTADASPLCEHDEQWTRRNPPYDISSARGGNC